MKIVVEERKGRTRWRIIEMVCSEEACLRRHPNKDRKEVRERAVCKSGEKRARQREYLCKGPEAGTCPEFLRLRPSQQLLHRVHSLTLHGGSERSSFFPKVTQWDLWGGI